MVRDTDSVAPFPANEAACLVLFLYRGFLSLSIRVGQQWNAGQDKRGRATSLVSCMGAPTHIPDKSGRSVQALRAVVVFGAETC